MKIDTFVLGDFQANCFCVRSSSSADKAVIIDLGAEADLMIDFLKQNKITPEIILLTHGHGDHIAGIDQLKQIWPDIPVAIHQNDADMLTNSAKNLSLVFAMPYQTQPADTFFEDNQKLVYAGIQLTVIHTPGHTPGCVCFHQPEEKILFAGDTLFCGSVGRTDFPNGSMSSLVKSIKNKLFPLPDETSVYPGHGPQTTIGYEKQTNPFLTEDF